jgi:predicted acyltransferase
MSGDLGESTKVLAPAGRLSWNGTSPCVFYFPSFFFTVLKAWPFSAPPSD